MTGNSAEILTIFLAPFIGLPIPLLPIHILWVNLVTDGLPALALCEEKAEEDIMKRPPRKPDESLFSEGVGYHIIWVGALMAGVTLFTQWWGINSGKEHWQTMVLTVLSFPSWDTSLLLEALSLWFIRLDFSVMLKCFLWYRLLSYFSLQLSIYHF